MSRRGFVLLEVLLAVAIFAIGVITLGRCVSNCIAAEQLKAESDRARQVLENRVAEIQSGAVPLTKEITEHLKAPFAGWTLRQKAIPLDRKNELGQPFQGLFTVTLDLTWPSHGRTNSRTVTFYAQSTTP
jgi:type II secretion system protein I